MKTIQQQTRGWLIFFISVLLLSGFTAIPLEQELEFLCRLFPLNSKAGNWLDQVYRGLKDTNNRYPFLAYGYDWLAFAHFVLAILFIGPLRDPVKNSWVIEFGIITCLLIIPCALVAGYVRGIPLWWRLIDCSFGIAGILPLLICRKRIQQAEKILID